MCTTKREPQFNLGTFSYVSINIGSSVITNVPHHCKMLMIGGTVGGWETEWGYMETLCIFAQFFLKPKKKKMSTTPPPKKEITGNGRGML